MDILLWLLMVAIYQMLLILPLGHSLAPVTSNGLLCKILPLLRWMMRLQLEKQSQLRFIGHLRGFPIGLVAPQVAVKVLRWRKGIRPNIMEYWPQHRQLICQALVLPNTGLSSSCAN
jgi:hypothetical protein